jgi:hypothetical protein
MFYAGLDIHSKRISICVLNETGQVAHRSQVRTIDQIGCIPGSDMAHCDAAGVRRRRREWEQPHTDSWRSAAAADAEWMSGKSRARLAPILTEPSSWMSDRRASEPKRLRALYCSQRSLDGKPVGRYPRGTL